MQPFVCSSRDGNKGSCLLEEHGDIEIKGKKKHKQKSKRAKTHLQKKQNKTIDKGGRGTQKKRERLCTTKKEIICQIVLKKKGNEWGGGVGISFLRQSKYPPERATALDILGEQGRG